MNSKSTKQIKHLYQYFRNSIKILTQKENYSMLSKKLFKQIRINHLKQPSFMS